MISAIWGIFPLKETDRTAWAAAYRFHEAAVARYGTMEQDPFWEWMAAQLIEISNAHDNGALIVALLIAVFDDLEQRDRAARQDPAPVKSA